MTSAGRDDPQWVAAGEPPGGVRRVSLRSGVIAVRHRLAAADPGAWPLVTSEGIGGAAPSADESGRLMVAPGYGRGGTVPSRAGSGRAESGSGGKGIAGSDMYLPSASGQGVA